MTVPELAGPPLTLPPGADVLPARLPDARRDPPRIAYVLWHFPVPSETFVINELRVLVEHGYDVRVFCTESPHGDFRPEFEITWQQVAGPDELAAALKSTGRTVAHSHFVYPTVTEFLWPAAETARIPFTFIAHAQDIFRYENDRRNRIDELSRSPWCEQVFVPARFHRQYLLDRGVDERKLRINPQAIDTRLFRDAFARRARHRSSRSVCAVQRFTEKKGLTHLVAAAPLLASQGISIHIHGYGPLGEELAAQIEAAGADNVRLHGPVTSRDELLEVFAVHDLFLAPAVRASDGDMDGIPTVLMEAMAAGLPVAASDCAGVPDLVTDGLTGLICDPSPQGIAHAITRFYDLPQAAVTAMVRTAREHVRQHYDVLATTQVLVRTWSRPGPDGRGPQPHEDTTPGRAAEDA